ARKSESQSSFPLAIHLSMNHSLSAPTSALREFNSLLCAVSTTFFLVFVKFFHPSGEAVFVSAVR
ncbi:MAG TPA: hypothetical protein H9774_02495, partial [Candidatus Desulfovibrio gallistercoris]|nr:hypothetical protein [Candidatus Desulfovibrio gallistercoris]